MRCTLNNLNLMSNSPKDIEIIGNCIDVQNDMPANKVDIINCKCGCIDEEAIRHSVKYTLGKNTMMLWPKNQIEQTVQSGDIIQRSEENIARYQCELGGDCKSLSTNVLVIESESHHLESQEYMLAMMTHKVNLEKCGGTVIFAVKGLDEASIHKYKLQYGLNTVSVTVDYTKLATEMYNKVFGYQPDEEMVQIILKAIKSVTHLSIDAIKREIEYLYDICSASNQSMPSVDFATKVLKVAGEKNYIEMFDGLIGLDERKQELMSIVKSHIISKRLNGENAISGLRLAISGKPGTGKSTLVKLIVAMLRQEGVLDDGSAYKIQSARELIGTAIGHSEDKVNKLVAENDVIVLDEIGALCPGSDGRTDTFTEAVNKLLIYYMEADSTKGKHFIFIGYPEEIKAYIETDAGLSSRIKNIVHLDEYKPEELVAIASQFMEQEKLKLDDSEQIQRLLEDFVGKSKSEIMNAREMRNLVDYVKEGAFVKYFDEKLSLDEGVRISSDDVRKGIDTYARKHKPTTNNSRPIGFAPVTVDATN